MGLLRKTFTDPDGSLSIPEIIAAVGALVGIVAPVFDWAARGVHFDLQGFGVGLASLVAALGVAQRLRDGVTRKDDDHA